MSYFFALRNLLSLSVWHPLFSKASAKVLPFFLSAKYFDENFSKICNFYAFRLAYVDIYQKQGLFLIMSLRFWVLVWLRWNARAFSWIVLSIVLVFSFDYTKSFLWFYWTAEPSTLTRRALGVAITSARQVDGERSATSWTFSSA